MLLRIILILFTLTCLTSPLSTTAQTVPLPTDLEVITPENAHRLVEVARIGNGQALYATWSPDGNQIAVASTVGVWLVSLDSPPRLLEGHRGLARHVAYSEDGLLMAAGDQHGTVYLWHGISGELLTRFESDLGEIARVEFSLNRNFLVAGNDFGAIVVWKISTGEIFCRYYTDESGWGYLIDIMFSPDGNYVAWGVIYYSDLGMDVTHWWLASMITPRLLPIPEWYSQQQFDGYVESSLIYFNEQSEPIIGTALTITDTSGKPSFQRVFQNFITGEITEDTDNLISLDEDDHTSSYEDVTFRLGNIGISIYAREDRYYEHPLISILHWTQQIRQVLIVPAKTEAGEIIPDQYYLLINYEPGQLEVWRVRPDITYLVFEQFISSLTVAAMEVSNAGRLRVIAGTGYGEIYYMDGDKNPEYDLYRFSMFRPTGYTITDLAFVPSPNNNDMAFAGIYRSTPTTLALWSDPYLSEEGEIIYQGGENTYITQLYYSAEKHHLRFRVGDRDCFCSQLLSYDFTTSEVSPFLDLDDKHNGEGMFSHSDSLFAVLNIGNSMSLVDAETGHEIATLWEDTPDDTRNNRISIWALQFSPDDRLLVAGYGGSMCMGCKSLISSPVRIWDVETGEELIVLEGHTSQVTGVAFSPDRKLLITGSLDGTVRFWGVPAGN